MLNNVLFGKYISGNSEVHNLNPSFKIISLIIMLISTLFINSYEDIIMLSSYLILSLVNSGISMKAYVKEFISLRIILLIIILINIMTFSTIEMLLSDILRIIFIVLYISLFIHTTTINEILYGIEAIVDPLKLERNSRAILYITLTMRFPRIFRDNISKVTRVLKERKVNRGHNLIEVFTYFKGILKRAFDLSVEELNNMIFIMKTRLYGYGKSRTNYRLNKVGIKEVFLLVLNIIILVIVIIY